MAFASLGTICLLSLSLIGNDALAGEAQVRSNAQSEQSRSLSGRRPVGIAAQTGLYVSESGERFVFDRSGARPLFRFQSRDETWVLRPSPAPRGDIIYRNDAGNQILRVTPDGGITLYTARAPNGTPASMSGNAPSLTPPSVSPSQLLNYSIQQSGRMSAAVGHLIYFDFDLQKPGNESVVAETVTVITEAVMRLARTSTTRADAARIRLVNVVEGTRPNATFANGTLTVTSVPSRGAEGRPSSARIIQAIRGS